MHDKFQLLKMAEEISPRLEYTGWADFGKEICYKENATIAEVCGPKDACHTKGLLLP